MFSVPWRRGITGRPNARCVALRIRIADGQAQQDRRQARSTCWERKPGWQARWTHEPTHQQLNEELGLDHFEGRSWTGLNRYALTTMFALAFLLASLLQFATELPTQHHNKPDLAIPS